MNPATISQLERDKHGWTSHTLAIFARAFNVPEHVILGYARPPDDAPEGPKAELSELLPELSDRDVQLLLVQAREMLKNS